MSSGTSFVRALARRSRQRFQGAIEFFRKPELRDSWGGPLNGQIHRQLMVRQIVAKLAPDYILETGTYRGTTTEFFSGLSRARVFTVETSPHYFGYSKTRLLFNLRVTIREADSRVFLRDFMAAGRDESQQLFIYLDAHWGADLPLREEVDIIFKAAPSSVVMIDDFEVFDDADYGYDDYGGGMALDVNYILTSVKQLGLIGFYPAVAAKNESGAKRGSIVLAKESVVIERLRELTALREISWPTANH